MVGVAAPAVADITRYFGRVSAPGRADRGSDRLDRRRGGEAVLVPHRRAGV
jgi:hypothetical protein